MSSLRIGAVGCGNQMAGNLVPSLQLHGLNLDAACDSNTAVLDNFCQRFGVTQKYTSAETMLAERDLDGVLIAVSGHQHPRLVEVCLRHGLLVYVEKPPARTVDDWKQVLGSVANASSRIMIGLNKRFAPAYRAAATVGRRVGDERPSALTISATYGPYETDEDFWYEFAIHYLDLADWILGGISSPYLRSAFSAGGAVHAITLEGRNGGVAQLLLSSLNDGGTGSESLATHWQMGRFEVENLSLASFVQPTAPANTNEHGTMLGAASHFWSPNHTIPSPLQSSLYVAGYLGAIGAFLNAIRLGVPPVPGGQSALRLLDLIHALQQLKGDRSE